MRQKEIRIFALNPGSRYAGFAVFHGSELADWGMKMRFKAESSISWLERLKRILTAAAERDSIECFTIKEFHPVRRSKRLLNITNELKAWAAKNGLTVCEYTIGETEQSLLPIGRLNKKRLMSEVAERYPILYPEFEREKRNKNPYFVCMFEAVALGMKCLSDLEKSKGRKSSSTIHEKGQ